MMKVELDTSSTDLVRLTAIRPNFHMCVERLGIGQCKDAVRNAQLTSRYCSGIHIVATHRYVCGRAAGRCLCFFGTYGTVNREADMTARSSLASLKVPCYPCMEERQQGRQGKSPSQIRENGVLDRGPVSASLLKQHLADIRQLWGGSKECPFHELLPDPFPRMECSASINYLSQDETCASNDDSRESSVMAFHRQTGPRATDSGIFTADGLPPRSNIPCIDVC